MRLMDYGGGLITGEIHQCFAFIFCKYNVAGKAEHVKQVDRRVLKFREDDRGAGFLCEFDYPQTDRDTDAVDLLRIAKIDHQRTATTTELPATFTLNLFT